MAVGAALHYTRAMSDWRLATEAEDEAVVALFLALNREDAGQERVDAEQARRTLRMLRAQPLRGRAVVLDVAGRIDGYALLIAFWSNEIGGEICCVDELYVAPRARGRGHASALLQALARERGPWPSGAVALILEVTPDNTRAIDFYERLGFRGKNRTLRLRVRRGDDDQPAAP
jgi:ribosomal protein S18 acetylase RimI-like enzyme